MKRTLTLVTALLALWPVWFGLAHAQQSGAFSTTAKNAILMDYDSGSIIYQKAADELVPPASMSKLMTLAVLFRALKDGKLKLEDEFQTSENSWRNGGAPSSAARHGRQLEEETAGTARLRGRRPAGRSGSGAPVPGSCARCG